MFKDLDYELPNKQIYGPNGAVKITDEIINGAHYSSEQ